MKRKYTCFLLLLPLLLTDCSINEIQEAKPSTEYLNLVGDVAFSATETNKTVDIEADCYWEISNFDNSSWEDLSISPLSGEGNAVITITSQENHSSNDRNAAITLTTKGGLTKVLSIQQTGSGADLSISQKEFNFNDVSETQSLVVTCNTTWEIFGETGADWLEIGQTSGGAGDVVIPISVKENYDDAPRTLLLTISAGSQGDNKMNFSIVQSGKSPLTLSVNPTVLPAFTSEGGEQVVNVECNGRWQVFVPQSAQQWLHVEPTSGIGNEEIQLTCDPYYITEYKRLSVLILSAGSQNPIQKELLVSQSVYATE